VPNQLGNGTQLLHTLGEVLVVGVELLLHGDDVLRRHAAADGSVVDDAGDVEHVGEALERCSAAGFAEDDIDH
jgi:hypothetical protein